MPPTNLERMIQLAEDVFAVKNDPDQLDVDQEVIEQLHRIHPATVSEYDDGNGPVAWVLIIPTTSELMYKFLEKEITELELFRQTPQGASYDSVYLCSALVLPEYRRKGIASQLSLKAIESIRKEHPIKSIFVWPFSNEGDLGAQAVADAAGLPLLKRQSH
ncbi:MAG: GNAT family N-acetyltransferase [Bacteroidetes bacterium]|nr:GNAT family N-acetyltransferase [Bacteroidota bacterium]